ncbi:MAG: DNA pilot protein [Microviridae sp.]|nr:MAG: DNA pilot protein [Microviridae sp.]
MPFATLIPLIASAVGGVASLIGQGAQAKSEADIARENTDKTNAANLAAAQNAFAQNHQMWLENNAYNSPQEQMARLKLAGLNPNLVYGNGAVGNASGTIPQYQAPRQSYDYKSASIAGRIPETIMSFMNLQLQQAQLDNTKAQTASVQTKTANDVLMGRFLSDSMDDRLAAAGLPRVKKERAIADYMLNYGDYFDGKQFRQTKGFTGLSQYQLEGAKVGVERQKKTVDKIIQDILFRSKQNEWMKQGITTSDSPLLRMLSRMVGSGGFDLNEWIRQNFNK